MQVVDVKHMKEYALQCNENQKINEELSYQFNTNKLYKVLQAARFVSLNIALLSALMFLTRIFILFESNSVLICEISAILIVLSSVTYIFMGIFLQKKEKDYKAKIRVIGDKLLLSKHLIEDVYIGRTKVDKPGSAVTLVFKNDSTSVITELSCILNYQAIQEGEERLDLDTMTLYYNVKIN